MEHEQYTKIDLFDGYATFNVTGDKKLAGEGASERETDDREVNSYA